MAQLKNKVKNALDEGRILVIGAQVLIGFQFRSAFEPGFEKLSEHAKYLKFGGLALLLLALALLIWPGTYHQIVERGEDTEDVHQFTSSVLAVAVLPFALGLGVDFLVGGEFLFGRTQGLIAGIIALTVALVFWYAIEIVQRRRYAAEIKKEQQMSKEQQKEEGGTKLKDKIQQVLTEVRVALPGAQALMGFQFISLFMDSFQKLSQPLKIVHFASLCMVGMSIILMMTPAAYHRIVERGEETKRFHRFASRILLGSLVPLALGISGDFYLVARKVTESDKISIPLAVGALLLFYGLWFGFTLGKRSAREVPHGKTVRPGVHALSR
jgi:cytochrome bd-type quinol oxidase subunit 2